MCRLACQPIFVVVKLSKTITMKKENKIALITGASRGLGLALARALAQRGWQLIINARNARELRRAQLELQQWTEVDAISGDVRDEILLLQFAELLERRDLRLDLLVNNASTLGASPQPPLLDFPIEAVHQVYHTNVIAPLSLLQKLRPLLTEGATIINISSDAAQEAYPGWGVYGAAKAALDHWTAVLAHEQPAWHVYAIDPGDMNTALQQQAFPGDDVSDRPLPEAQAVPAILQLLTDLPAAGRYTAADLYATTAA